MMNQPEPMPNPGNQDVGPSLKQRFGDFIDQRTEFGIGKYGTPLQTGNGRNPRVDMTQEILDFTQYQEQDRMELAVALTQARIEIENLTTALNNSKAAYDQMREANDKLRQRLYDLGERIDPCAEDDLIHGSGGHSGMDPDDLSC